MGWILPAIMIGSQLLGAHQQSKANKKANKEAILLRQQALQDEKWNKVRTLLGGGIPGSGYVPQVQKRSTTQPYVGGALNALMMMMASGVWDGKKQTPSKEGWRKES